ncbi:molybdopterin-dependent oxidoreductase [Aeromonas schubertii]|uniref:Molybdopterin-dependent oxidoreductase n=1 Tax=Aeromonas schubertii TaxID=652 RepID=A0ABS7VFY4_9GAMM|nr:molybdopterin-dependent oxidoreductase [Aeromonas schubertii]MBZ6067951.1 molybdopterin-dependent oxidoreductase [Aeromonas schubertii]
MRSVCAYCGVGCGVRVEREGEVWHLSGDEAHPANRGALCIKGASLIESLDIPRRLLYPRWGGERIGWEAALDRLAGELTRIIGESGPESVALYLSGQLTCEDYYVANKLMKGFIGSPHVDTNSRLCMASAVVAHQRAFGEDLVPACYEDLELADLVVLAGANTAWTHPVLFRRLQQARERRPAMRLVVIDPRETMTASQGDLHLPLRPGSDLALWSGLGRYLLDEGLWDREYVARHVAGFDALAATLDDPRWRPEAVAEACDLPLADLLGFYRLFGATARTLTLFCQGINQSRQGGDQAGAIINAHLLTGRIGKPGAAPFSMTGQPNAMGGREVGGLATQLAAHMGFDQESQDRLARFWGAPRVVTGPGHKAVDLFEAVHRGEIRALWVLGTNPAASLPDTLRVREALARCELLVVSEITDQSDTAGFAHLLLPAAAWGEKGGTVTNSERTLSRQRPFLPPPGEVRPDWWALTQVARRLGFEQAFPYEHEHQIFCEHAALSGFENRGERHFDISALATLTREQYEGLEPLSWPVNRAHPAGCRRLFEDGRFATPDGRARLVVPAEPGPVTLAPAQRGETPVPGVGLLLNSGRLRDQWHTMTRTGHVARLQEAEPWPTLRLGAASLRTLGAEPGDLLAIESEQGLAHALAERDEGLREGEAFMPMHWSEAHGRGAGVNRLVAPRVDPLSGQPAFKQSRVWVSARPLLWQGLWLGSEPWAHPIEWWARRTLGTHGGALCQWLASWQESEAQSWGRLNRAGNWLRLPQARGWLAIELCQGRINSLLLVTPTPRSVRIDTLASLLGAPLQADALITTLDQALAGASRLICSCLRVSERQILAAIEEQGIGEVAGLQALLGCGSNCGTCLPEVARLVERHRSD